MGKVTDQTTIDILQEAISSPDGIVCGTIENQLHIYDDVKKVFKDGDWVFGIGEHKGCSEVFTDNGIIQPFSYLSATDPNDFRIATEEEIRAAKVHCGI